MAKTQYYCRVLFQQAERLLLVGPVNGPYVCPICPDKRGYKEDSSLRKHMRLHHPSYKRSSKVDQSASLTKTGFTPDNTQSTEGGGSSESGDIDQQRASCPF